MWEIVYTKQAQQDTKKMKILCSYVIFTLLL